MRTSPPSLLVRVGVPAHRWVGFELRTALLLAFVLISQPAWSQAPPEPPDSNGEVTLQITMPKLSWKVGEVPEIDIVVRNESDEKVVVRFNYFAKLILDGRGFHKSGRVPLLGGGEGYSYASHSVKNRDGLSLDASWMTSKKVEHDGGSKAEPVPLTLPAGEHEVELWLGGSTASKKHFYLQTNRIRFTVVE